MFIHDDGKIKIVSISYSVSTDSCHFGTVFDTYENGDTVIEYFLTI
jgi:hypothetical protein